MLRRKRLNVSVTRAPWAKKRRTVGRRYKGLVPQYSGWTPRSLRLGEWKYHDNVDSHDINSTPGLFLMNGLAPGNSATTRVGQSVSIRTLEIRAQGWVTATTGVVNMCRALLVLDKQTNGAAPTAITDILQANNVLSPRNLGNRRRFKILWDKLFMLGGVLNGAGTGSSVPEQKVFKSYIKFRRPIIEEFNTGNAGDVTDITSNSIYLLLVGNIAAGATDANLTYYIRMRYTDM